MPGRTKHHLGSRRPTEPTMARQIVRADISFHFMDDRRLLAAASPPHQILSQQFARQSSVGRA